MDMLEMLAMLMGGNGSPDGNVYNSIHQLHNMLEEANIPHRIRRLMDGYQILYYGKDPILEQNNALGSRCDVIEHMGSYGHEKDLLEVAGCIVGDDINDTVEGFLTAEEVFNRIKADYESL